ncbi:hypothetical protein G6F60_015685 [Rhizopus arrhizus]|nr:hypothetical protein G6F60_015685 [Rhizopus arrhizus]
MPATATSAPAAASAPAMPWPRPVLPPVTRATLPSRLKGLAIAYAFLDRGERDQRQRPPARGAWRPGRAYLSWQMSSTCMSV